MSIIRVADLVMEFSRPKRVEGWFSGPRTMLTRKRVLNRAVDGISFEIQPGELVGYLGSNGAGKSTTIKVLTGILVPTSGVVEVAGRTPWRDRKRNAKLIGVVFGQRSQLWWDLPLRDSLQTIARLYDVPRSEFVKRQKHLIDLLDMGSFLDTPVRHLSLGQRMRGDLAAAMLHAPQILYLDEPTVGLDLVAKERIREFVSTLNRESGTTVILTTHDLDDVERLCRRIIFISKGQVAYDGDLDMLKARYTPHRELVVRSTDAITVPGVQTIKQEGGKIWLRFDPERTAVNELISAILARHQVTDLSIVEPDLESVIRQIYAEQA